MSKSKIIILLASLIVLIAVVILAKATVFSSDSQVIAVSKCKSSGSVEKDSQCLADLVNQQIVDNNKQPSVFIPRLELFLNSVQNRDGQTLYSICHQAMHISGREYARDKKISLGTLQEYIPRSNDTNCSAGFVHGMMTTLGVGDPSKVKEMLSFCSREPTRLRKTSCVHGIGHAARRGLYNDPNLDKAVAVCRSLGPRFAADCAQGIYHDYIFAITGLDNATRPKNARGTAALCQDKPSYLIGACWYRLFYYSPGLFGTKDPKVALEFCSAQKNSRECFSSVIAANNRSPQIIKACRQFRGQTAEDCFASFYQEDRDGIGLSPEEQNQAQAREQFSDKRLKELSKFINGCRLMLDKRSQNACVFWYSYHAIQGVFADQSKTDSNKFCQLLDSEFQGLCRKAKRKAEMRGFPST